MSQCKLFSHATFGSDHAKPDWVILTVLSLAASTTQPLATLASQDLMQRETRSAASSRLPLDRRGFTPRQLTLGLRVSFVVL